jgi:hypothetical protein
VERAEWVNRIIKQAWPYANKYLDQCVFRDVIIPLIRGTSAALSDFSFEKLDLGEIVCLKKRKKFRLLDFIYSHRELEVLKFIQIMFEIK